MADVREVIARALSGAPSPSKRSLSKADAIIAALTEAGALRGEKQERPSEPEAGHDVWYRGWECGYDIDAALWSGEGWRAYKGGADIDAPRLSAKTFLDLIDEIEDQEEPAPAQCQNSPTGRCQVDTSMESGPNNCFYCEQRMPLPTPPETNNEA